jgi:hypothetical protein
MTYFALAGRQDESISPGFVDAAPAAGGPHIVSVRLVDVRAGAPFLYPLLQPGYLRRRRLRDPALLVRREVLRRDQHRVPEAASAELRGEGQGALPVLTRHQRSDGLGQLLLERLELRFAGRSSSDLSGHGAAISRNSGSIERPGAPICVCAGDLGSVLSRA